MLDRKHVAFSGRLVIVGFGSIGQGVLPLLLRHLEIDRSQITIMTAEPRGHEVAAEYGIRFTETALTRENYRAMLDSQLGRGDFLLNVSVDVSSVALIELCQEKGALYLDTCIEPWPGGYTDPSLPPAARSNYALRESALALRRRYPGGPTAILTHGANPGLVSHFVKQALIDLAQASGLGASVPRGRADWALLAERLGLKVIHIAERDTQVARLSKEFLDRVNQERLHARRSIKGGYRWISTMISHDREDARLTAEAEAYQTALEGAGFDTWRYATNTDGHQPLTTVADEIEKRHFFLPFLSASYRSQRVCSVS